MVDPQREPLEGVVEFDQAEIPFQADNTFFDPAKSGKILVAGAVEVIDRGANQAKPRRKGVKYLDTRSGRIRLAAIPDNSAASQEAFVRANVRPGTTLLTDGHRSCPGLTGYRHDPRTVGKMAGHVVLPRIHRVFSLLKRWGLGTYHGLRRKHIDTYLNEAGAHGPASATSRDRGSTGGEPARRHGRLRPLVVARRRSRRRHDRRRRLPPLAIARGLAHVSRELLPHMTVPLLMSH
jgi:hypothetical protein